ncbi:hypothetical protein ACLB2K_026805 [Fragaria x ananassa]
MWRVSSRLAGDCRYCALRPLHGESVRAWLARLSLCGESVCAWLTTVAIVRCDRCVAICAWLGRLAIERCGPLRGESVRAWLARLSLLSDAAAAWRVSPCLVGETIAIERCGRCVASQSALGWGDLLLSVAGRCVASQSALGWGDSLLSVTAAAWRVSPRLVGETVVIERYGRCVASQSALGWRDCRY